MALITQLMLELFFYGTQETLFSMLNENFFIYMALLTHDLTFLKYFYRD